MRQAACYGLGVFASNTPSSVINPGMIEAWLQALINAAKIAKGSEKEKTYGHCRDNAVAGIGKIVKVHGSAYDPKPYLNIWLTMLPLKSVSYTHLTLPTTPYV